MRSTIELFNLTLDGLNTERVLSYDLIMNKEVFGRFGGGAGDLFEQNARMLKAIGLDCTRSIFDPKTHWLDSKIECWEKYLGMPPNGFRVSEGGGTSWISGRPFCSTEELKRNLPKMPNIDEVAEWYVPFIKRVKKVFDENDLVFIGEVEGPLTDAYNFVDMERFCCLVYDEPDIVDYMLDVTTAWSSIIIKLYSEFPASRAFVFGEDIAYKTSTMFSRDFLREKLYPRWKKAVEPLRRAGIKLIYHSDGNLNTVLDDLVREIGIDGLNPIEPTADMDIFGISEKYPALLLLGNIDTAGELLNDDPCAVEDAVRELLRRVGKKGRLLAGSSTEISDAVKVPNVLALYSAIRKYGSLSDGESLQSK